MASKSRSALLAAAGLALGTAGCAAGFSGASWGAAARVPLAPAGVYVDDDVADGYVAYAAALGAAGRWESDASYGVHWCPARAESGAPFRPYVSKGHWATVENARYGGQPGTVYWADDSGEPWLEITTHHGWWVERGRNDWCWVPGARESPARVVWRTSDDFVGWAPEPPMWIDDGDESVDAGFEWCFELLGTLLEDVLDGYVLTGDAAQVAQQAAAPSRHTGNTSPFSRFAPARPVVEAARRQLVAFVQDRSIEVPSSTTATANAASASPGQGSHGATGESDDKKSSTSTEVVPPAAVILAFVPYAPVEWRGGVPFHPPARGGPSSPSWHGTSSEGASWASSAAAPRYHEGSAARVTSHTTSSGDSHPHSSGSASSSHHPK
jgi:hypothetical protein